ncbi:putative cell survival pathways protein [Dispira simplex]|nr:putative cell survival pathways protein [Dispira simplex]
MEPSKTGTQRRRFITTIETNAAFSDGQSINIFQNFNGGKISVSTNRLSAECKGLSITASTQEYERSLLGVTYLVKMTGGSDLNGELTYHFRNPGFKVGHEGRYYMGNTSVTDGPPSGQDSSYIKHIYGPGASVSGWIKARGVTYNMDGAGLFIHAQSDMKPYTVADKWHFAYFAGEDVVLNMLQFKTLEKAGGVRVNKASYTEGGELRAISIGNQIELSDFKHDNVSGYDVAGHVVYTWEGQTVDGKQFQAKVEVNSTNLISRIDILHQLPYFVRKVIQALITKPFIYEWFDTAMATITVDGDERKVSGKIFHEVTMLQ